MEIAQFSQIQVFLFAVIFGLLLGVLYDLFRFLRILGLNGKIHILILDVLFLSLCACASFIFAVAFNEGEIRGFTLLAHLCGILLYRFSVGILTGKLFVLLSLFLKRIFQLFIKGYCLFVGILYSLGQIVLKKFSIKKKKISKTSCKIKHL
ncbi:MAG: spore cortex biosynthesis protein YabQ [Acutalibacteraceae bacterium]